MDDELVSDESPVESTPHVDEKTTKNVKAQPTRQDVTTSSIHQLKWIPWQGGFVPIVTQNENGPCPLLALCNVLILTKMIKITPGETVVTSQQLMDLLGSCLIQSRPKDLPECDECNYEQNMQDAISVFPRLLTGLDVNVKFSSVSGFEFTQELAIFDLLSVQLYHGWLVDPNDHTSYDVVAPYTYNQLVEYAINNASSEDSVIAQKALLAHQFLEDTATQLTYHGLYELNKSVDEGEFCVFFRNNHFNTMLKRKEQLLLLVTDYGFLDELGHVWHVLSDIDDSGDFLDAQFQFSTGMGNTESTVTTQQQTRTAMNDDETGLHVLIDQTVIDQDETIIPHPGNLDVEIAAGLQAHEDGFVPDIVTVVPAPPPETATTLNLLADEELAMRLQEEELSQFQPQSTHSPQRTPVDPAITHVNDPSPRHGPPPITKEEYEQISQAERRGRSHSNDCSIL